MRKMRGACGAVGWEDEGRRRVNEAEERRNEERRVKEGVI